MATSDLTTLANLKLWLPINAGTTSDDTTIGRLITAVSADFTRATGRPDLLSEDYTEARVGDGAARMIAYHWPITAIGSLTIGGVTIPESSDKVAAGWFIDEDIDPERVWNIYLNGYSFADGASVVLEYTAGYETAPGDVEQAVIDWCAYRYKERPNVAASQRRSTEGESIQTELLDAPPNVLAVIQRYARKVPSVDRRADERELLHARNSAGKTRR